MTSRRVWIAAASAAAVLMGAPGAAGARWSSGAGSAPAAASAPEPAGFATVPGCDFLDPSVCLLPFPNDWFTRLDPSTPTGRRLDLQPAAMPRNVAGKPIDPIDWNRNDGFSPGSPILVKVPGLDSPAAFDRTRLVSQTDMARSFARKQPAVVIDAQTGRRQLIWAELDKTADRDSDRVLIIRPGRNLREGRRYIVALRNLRDAQGDPIPAQRPFRVYRDRIATLDPVVERRRTHMEDIFERLARARIERDELYLAWDFTVASERDRTERARWMRDEAFGQLGDFVLDDLKVEGAAPAFEVTRVRKLTPEQHDRTAREIDGHFTVPCFLNLPGCRPGSRFAYALPTDTRPQPIPGNTLKANFRCIVPHTALDPAAEPARPSLYGHGLLGTRSEVGQGQLRSMAQEHNMVFCATDWIGMSIADAPGEPAQYGDLPAIATILADVSNFPMLADRVQQGLLNFMFLGRLMVHPHGFSGHEAFRKAIEGEESASILDTRRLFYDGNSQGGIIGGALMALTPDAEHGVLGVPGMNYSTLLNRSVDFELDPDGPCPPDPRDVEWGELDPRDPEGALEELNFSYACPLYAAYPDQLQRQLLFGLMQQLWDRAEANGYAAHMTDDPLADTPEHRVLLHVALGDHQVAQVSAEVEARTIGAWSRPAPMDPARYFEEEPLLDIPRIASYPFAGSAIEIWDSGPVRADGTLGTPPAPVGNVPPRVGKDPHEEPRNTIAARLQKNAFLRIGGRVEDFCGGAPCRSRNW